MRGDRVGDVGVVVAVAGRSLHQHRFPDAGLVHRGEHHFKADRALARPVRLAASERRKRVALRILGDDVRMDVDDRAHTTRPTAFTTFAIVS